MIKRFSLLYVCCRYTGSGIAPAANSENQSQAKLILQQLHEQAELRRQERESLVSCKRKSPDTVGK